MFAGAALTRCCRCLGDGELAGKLQEFLKTTSHQELPLPRLLKEPLQRRCESAAEADMSWFSVRFPVPAQESLQDGGDFFDKDTLAFLLATFQEEASGIVSQIVDIHVRGSFSVEETAELFRFAHTLKGAAATVGLSAVSREALVLESYLRAHRDARTRPSELALPFLDLAAAQFIGMVENGHMEEILPNGSLLECARAMDGSADPWTLFQDAAAPSPPVESSPVFSLESGPEKDSKSAALDDEMASVLMEVFQTEAQEHLDALDRNLELLAGGQPVIQELFRTTHTLKGAAGTVGITWLKDAAHRMEDYFDALLQRRMMPPASSMQYLFQAASFLRNHVGRTQVDLEPFENLLSQAASVDAQQRLHAGSREASSPAAPVQPPSPVPEDAASPGIAAAPPVDARFTRVPSQKLDELFSDAEELVLVRTQLEKSRDEVQSISSDLFLSHHTLRNFLLEGRNTMTEAERLERLQEVEVELAELINNLEHASSLLQKECKSLQSLSQRFQRNLVEMRVTNLELLFLKVRQTIRDAAFASGKQVEFTCDGESVELDKSVIAALSAPLLQVARNAVAHGVLPEAERLRLNLEGPGHIHLSARQEGRFILLELSDDGPGIDPERIRQKLVEMKILDESAARRMQDEDVLDAIFLPGFTTRDSADALSGRGVGLEMVRSQVRRIGGEVTVYSAHQKGCSFHIRVPLTSVVSQALIFRLGQEFYGIPAAYVVEVFETVVSRELEPGSRILWRKESIPVVPLHYFFGLEQNIVFRRSVPVIIMQHGGKHFGITVDSLIGIKDVTTKPLNHLLSALSFFSAAMMSGAGMLQLMFDVPFLASLARPVFGVFSHVGRGSAYRVPRILVCDDSKSVREAASRVLVDAGYHTVVAADGWEAWNALHADEFDLLLTDLEMPRMSGYELVQEVKQDSMLQEIPIVVLSSRTGETSRERVRAAGAECFVSKPIKPMVLLKAIREFIPIEERLVTRKILIFATHNPGKARELQVLLAGLAIDVWSLDRFPDLPPLIEDGSTFEENARKKALIRARQTGLPTLADDSGLMVDALGGAPGVNSARYAGEHAADRDRVERLLLEMAGKTSRAARFVSVIAFCPNPASDEVIVVRGELEGMITTAPRGEHGFGYDPVFELFSGRTLAELTLEEKSEISHRARAFALILPHLKRFAGME